MYTVDSCLGPEVGWAKLRNVQNLMVINALYCIFSNLLV
jgi:hypothetical protein